MNDRPKLEPALGLVRDRIGAPPPRRATPAAPITTPGPSETPRSESSASEKASAEIKPKKTSRSRASSASTGGLRRTTISLPQELAAKMRENLQADRSLTQIQFILNAIETNAHRLAELVTAERPTAAKGGGLFPDQGSVRGSVEERTTINFDTTEANLKVIDGLVEKSGAASRSQLIRVALRAEMAAS